MKKLLGKIWPKNFSFSSSFCFTPSPYTSPLRNRYNVCLSVCLSSLSICLFICLSVCLYVCPSVRFSCSSLFCFTLSAYTSPLQNRCNICLSVCLSSLSICLFICLSVCLYVCPSVRFSFSSLFCFTLSAYISPLQNRYNVCLSVCLSVFSVCMSVYLSVRLFVLSSSLLFWFILSPYNSLLQKRYNIRLSIYLCVFSVCLSVFLSVCSSVHLFASPSVCFVIFLVVPLDSLTHYFTIAKHHLLITVCLSVCPFVRLRNIF
jgi:hypothetical protein